MNSDERSRVLDRLGLPQPLGSVLDAAGLQSTAQSQARAWAGIATRLDADRRRSAPPRLLLLAFGMCAVLAFFVGTLRPWAGAKVPAVVPPRDEVAAPTSASRDASPDLKLASGAVFEGLTPAPSPALPYVPSTVTFEDGSTLTALDPETLVLPLAMNERHVTLRLARGTLDVHVVKGGSRQWTIEAGALSVEVVGTRFTVSRTENRASVNVTEGVVLARSPKLTEGAERVVAGEDLHVEITGSLASDSDSAGSYTATSSLPGATTSAGPSFESLSETADAARQSGDLPTAKRSLQRALRAFPHDPRTGVVAFQLALVMQQMGAPPSQVVQAFETALAKAHGQSLRQDCYWRLVLALEHAGRWDSAIERAKQSLREYPRGRYAPELTRRVAPVPTP